MKRSTFDGIIKIIEAGRGPKPKQETIEGAYEVVCNPMVKGAGRYEKRLAGRVLSIAMELKGASTSVTESFRVFIGINAIKVSEATDAVKMCIEKGCTLSFASVTLGAYSAHVYKMKSALDTFHKTRIALEL